MGTILLWLGTIGSLASAAWWWWYFTEIARQFGSRASPPTECLFSTPTGCAMLNGIAQIGGYTPYSPTLLWISIVVFVVGFVTYLVARSSSR